MRNIKLQLNIDRERFKKKLGIKGDEEIIKGVLKKIPKVKNGEDGAPGLPGKDGSPDTPDAVIEKINSSKKKIDQERIKDLKKTLEDIESRIKTAEATVRTNSGFFMKFAGDTVHVEDISDLLDGVTKTFPIPHHNKIVGVGLWSAPVLRPGIDYTRTATSITFTDEIDASTLLATGQSALVQYTLP